MSKNTNSQQRIEQLLREAFAKGGYIGVWEYGQKDKGKPVPENLLEESFLKFLEDHKDFISRLSLD